MHLTTEFKFLCLQFLRILSEDDAESSSRSTMDAELSLANAVNAMVQSVQDKQGISHNHS